VGESRNPSAAPGDLELVRTFVNTLDVEAGTDELGTPADATAWLGAHDVPARVSARDLRELVSLREAVRDLVSARGSPQEEAAAGRIDVVARRHPLTVRVSAPAALAPVGSTGVDRFVGRILALVVAARIDGSWERMKTCANGRCRWLYYDHSRNGSRAWCSMDVCGSRAKMRTYRSRRTARA
jgi:predicted RNA-binding Zn ribbon-like protein